MKQALPCIISFPVSLPGVRLYFPAPLGSGDGEFALGGGGLLQRTSGVRAGERPLAEGGSGTHNIRLFYRNGGRGGDPAGAAVIRR